MMQFFLGWIQRRPTYSLEVLGLNLQITELISKSSGDFMATCYENWLEFIYDKKPVQDWAHYVLVGK